MASALGQPSKTLRGGFVLLMLSQVACDDITCVDTATCTFPKDDAGRASLDAGDPNDNHSRRRVTRNNYALLLSEVVRFCPNVPFLPWLGEWQERFSWINCVSPDVVAELLRGLVTELLSKGLEAGGEENLEAVLQAAQVLQTAHPQHSRLRTARMWVYRQLGETAAALSLSVEAPVTWEGDLERALTLRSLGQRNEEVSALRGALVLGPNEPSLYFELVSALVHLRRRAGALEVLRQASEHAPSASISAALEYLEWLAGNSTSPPAPSDGYAAPTFSRDARCYRDTLPDPNDEAVSVVRGALSRAAGTNTSRIDDFRDLRARIAFEGWDAP